MEFLVLFGAITIVVLFVVGRAAVLWYWRVNETLALLTEINANLQRIHHAQITGAVKRELVS